MVGSSPEGGLEKGSVPRDLRAGRTVRGGAAWGAKPRGPWAHPGGRRGGPLPPFLVPTRRALLLRVLTWGVAWTEPSTTPRCQVGGDTPCQDVSGRAGAGGRVSWAPTSLSLCSCPWLQQRISPQLVRSGACSRPACRPADSDCWFGQERKRESRGESDGGRTQPSQPGTAGRGEGGAWPGQKPLSPSLGDALCLSLVSFAHDWGP